MEKKLLIIILCFFMGCNPDSSGEIDSDSSGEKDPYNSKVIRPGIIDKDGYCLLGTVEDLCSFYSSDLNPCLGAEKYIEDTIDDVISGAKETGGGFASVSECVAKDGIEYLSFSALQGLGVPEGGSPIYYFNAETKDFIGMYSPTDYDAYCDGNSTDGWYGEVVDSCKAEEKEDTEELDTIKEDYPGQTYFNCLGNSEEDIIWNEETCIHRLSST